MAAVGTPAVDVDCGIPPRWRPRRDRHLTPEGAQRGGPPHEARDDSLPFSGFIPLLVGRGLGAQAPGPLVFLEPLNNLLRSAACAPAVLGMLMY